MTLQFFKRNFGNIRRKNTDSFMSKRIWFLFRVKYFIFLLGGKHSPSLKSEIVGPYVIQMKSVKIITSTKIEFHPAFFFTFCSDFDDKHQCIQSIIRPMNCSTEYYETVTHLYYSVIPPPCQNESDAFYWLYRYGLKSNESNAPTFTTWLFLISNFILQL